jgi:predicted phosphodiesterase
MNNTGKYILLIGLISLLVYAFLPWSASNAAAPIYAAKKSANIKIGIVSDTHIPTSTGIWNASTYLNQSFDGKEVLGHIIQYFNDQEVNLMVDCGDLTISDYIASTDGDTLKTWLGDSLSTGIALSLVAGNHDTRHTALLPSQPDTVMYPDLTENPFQRLRDQFPSMFTNKYMYHGVDIGQVRLLFLNTNVDTTSDGHQRYANTNPPGKGKNYWNDPASNGDSDDSDWNSSDGDGNSSYTNPDYGGIETDGSDQWNWVIEELDSHDGTFAIAFSHRGFYSAIDFTNRPNMIGGRAKLLAQMTERGMDLVVNGDTHAISFSKRIHTEEDGSEYVDDVMDVTDAYFDSSYTKVATGDPIGAYHASISTGARRDTTGSSTQFPNGNTDVLWARGNSAADPDTTITATRYVFTYFMMLTINGPRMYVEYFHVGLNGSNQLTVVKDYGRLIYSGQEGTEG